MATYNVLKHWSYEPRGMVLNWKKFQPNDVVVYPGLQFPTILPIAGMIADGVLEEVISA